ncbi:MAG: mechanosensitive ion channel family protein [Gammaproteobacteria bacterium]
MSDFGFNLGKDTIWVIQIFVIVLAALVLDFFQRKALKRIIHKLEATSTIWDDAVAHAAQKPLSLLIWAIGIYLAASIAGQQAESVLLQYIDPLRDVLVIFAITWFLIRFIKQSELRLIEVRQAKGEPVDLTTMDAIAKLLRLSVLITAVLVALQTLGFSISGVLAFGGVGGIAVGFAARDLLANFFGGLMIYMDRPFSVGDWVRSPDRNIEGTVEEIGWRLTRIRTFDKRPLYVPNSTFASIAVENPSRMSHRRIYETVGVRYDDADKLQSIIGDVVNMLKTHPEIDESQTLIVNFNEFGPSSLDFFVYTFTHTTNWIKFHEVKQDVLFKIYEIITRHGAEVAFPTSTIHVPEPVQLNDAPARAIPVRDSSVPAIT